MNNDDKKKTEELKEEELQKTKELSDEELDQIAGGKKLNVYVSHVSP